MTLGPEEATQSSGQNPLPSREGLFCLLEDSLEAAVRPGKLFSERCALPVPGMALLAANFSFFAAGTALVGALLAAVAGAGAAPGSPGGWLAAGGIFIAGGLAGGLAGAVLTHLAALISGGSGGLGRSLQIVSLSSPIFALGLIVQWAPPLWPLPLIWAAFVAGTGITILHRAPAARTWAVVALAAALGLGAQWSARRRMEILAQSAASFNSQAEQMRKVAEALQSAGMTQGAFPPPGWPPAAGTQIPGMGAAPAAPGTPGASSLDLVAPGSVQGSGQGLPPQMNQGIQQIQQSAGNMVGSVLPMVNNPELLKLLPPEQAKMMKDLGAILSQAQGQIQGTPMTPEQQRQAYQKILEMQQTMMKMANQGNTAPPPPAPPKKAGKTP